MSTGASDIVSYSVTFYITIMTLYKTDIKPQTILTRHDYIWRCTGPVTIRVTDAPAPTPPL